MQDYKMITDTIEIPISWKKCVLALLGCLAFVMLAFFIWNIAEYWFEKFIVIGGLVFFGTGGIYVVWTLFCMIFDKKKLVIDNIGIILPLTNQRILWENIVEMNKVEIYGEISITLIVNNPDEYINICKNPIRRYMAKLNYTFFGSPVSIPVSALKCKYNELENILTERLYNKPKNN